MTAPEPSRPRRAERAARPETIFDKGVQHERTAVAWERTAIGAGITASSTYLDSLVAVTLLAFIATITVSRYVERRGARA